MIRNSNNIIVAIMDQALELWNNLDTKAKVATVTAVAAPLLYFARKHFEGGVNQYRTDLTGKAPPLMRTEEGFELQFGVNHLAHFLMTNLLLKDNLINENGARVIVLSSLAHTYAKTGIRFDDPNFEKQGSYNRWAAYGQSKLANILFAKELNKRMKEQGKKIVAVSLHPGVVVTELGRHLVPAWLAPFLFLQRFFSKTPYQGAQTTLHCALSPDIVNQGGEYFSDCAIKQSTPISMDSTQASRLWELSEKLVGL